MAKRKRRAFAPEFKADAVKLVQAGDRTIPQVAKELDLTETALRDWVRRAWEGFDVPITTTDTYQFWVPHATNKNGCYIGNAVIAGDAGGRMIVAGTFSGTLDLGGNHLSRGEGNAVVLAAFAC